MSGIAAAIRFDGGPPPVRELHAMIAAAAHRAPDGYAIWNGGGAALAKLHRLVLPGQRASDQPVLERGGPHVTIFDGRLDDRSALAARLPRHPLRDDDDDGAYASAAVSRFGAEAPDVMDGDFAFVAWNASTRTVVAARDRLGMRPLHWAIDGPHLLIASDIAQILASMARVPPPDETAVADLLGFEPATDARTLYAGVQRVPPGHALVVDARGARLREYWRPEPGVADERRSDDDYAEECRTLLQRAVGARLRASTPVVMFFSGGIDSSSVLSAALDAAQRTGESAPRPLSMIFDQPESDEREYRRAFAARSGLMPMEVAPAPLSREGYELQARRRLVPPDLPAEYIGQPLMWRAKEIGARVALTGGGGDFLFGGSPLQYADLIRRGRLVAAVAQYVRDAKTDDSGWSATGLLTAGVWPLLPQRVRSVLRGPAARITGENAQPPWLRLPRAGRSAVPDPPRGVSHASWEICWSLRSGWTSFFMESGERGASESGVEPRHPLLDPAIVRFALSLPETQRRRGRTMKYVLRRAVNLPPQIHTRLTKADFGYVMLDAFEVLGGRRFFETLQICEAGWVDPRAACTGYDLVRSRSPLTDPEAAALLPRLWILAAVELWHRAAFGAASVRSGY
jgi:asparagine synthase (glutamine-hydrolysing)